jgi:hypothetical protein
MLSTVGFQETGSTRRSGLAAAGLLLLSLALLAGAAPAQAAVTHVLTGTFNEGGTLTEPGAIAVDTSTGSVYVVTGGSPFSGGSKVEKFDASGNSSNFSFLGANSFTACVGCIRGIAVDNSAGVDHGVIYLATTSGNILIYRASGQFVQSFRYSHVIREKFPSDGRYCGVAVDSSGNLYIQHDSGFFEKGSFTDKFHPGRWKINPNPPQIWPVGGVFQQPEEGGTCKIASDANQYLYTALGEYAGSGTLKRWPMSAVDLVAPPSKTIDTGVTAFTADQATADVYSDESTRVTRFDSEGEPVEVFGEGDLGNSTAIAVNSLNGTAYVADRETNDVKIYGAATTPDVSNVSAATGQTGATVSAHLDTAGAGAVTGCEVEYGLEPTYGTAVACSGTLPTSGGGDVTANISGLTTEALYHFRVRATNANGTTRTIDSTFVPHAVSDVQALTATNITRTSATLNGSFSGNGEPTTYHFEWGTSTSYGNSTPVSGPSSATGTVSASADLSGLDVYREDSPPYHYRLVATNAVGTTYGPDMTFHTLPPELPQISGASASDVTPGSATLSAQINPGLGDTIYLFEYGTGETYGQATVPSASVGSDETPHPVSNEISGLEPSTTYHFRVVATNFGGTSYGSDQTFSTPGPPVIGSTSSSGVTQTGATLEARIRPALSSTTYHFEYGTSGSYGAITPESASIGGDNAEHPVSQAIGTLAPATTYHFRVVASNGFGTTPGPDQTFQTQPAPTPPRQAKPPLKCKRGFVKRHGKCVKKKKHHRRHRHHHRGGGRR